MDENGDLSLMNTPKPYLLYNLFVDGNNLKYIQEITILKNYKIKNSNKLYSVNNGQYTVVSNIVICTKCMILCQRKLTKLIIRCLCKIYDDV